MILFYFFILLFTYLLFESYSYSRFLKIFPKSTSFAASQFQLICYPFYINKSIVVKIRILQIINILKNN